jgi:hypothetical protein
VDHAGEFVVRQVESLWVWHAIANVDGYLSTKLVILDNKFSSKAGHK